MRIKVTFVPENRSVHVSEGTPVIDAAKKADVLLLAPCGGCKGCGRCKIHVTSSASVPEPSIVEKERLDPGELERGIRMACQFKIPAEGDLTIEACQKFQFLNKGGLLGKIGREQGRGVNVLNIATEPDKENMSLEERIVSGAKKAGFRHVEISPDVLRKASKSPLKSADLLAAVVGKKVLDIYPAIRKKRHLGVALDLGTTTLVGYLVDLISGTCIEERNCLNPNESYGADVMSRISCISREPIKLQTMHGELIGAINSMLDGFAEGEGSQDAIISLVTVGNTFMVHLFWDISPESLALSPYVPVFKGKLEGRGRDLGLKINQEALVVTLPCIGGFVGADTTAAVLATSISELEGCRVLVDLGTNGEIVLVNGGRMLATSVAAGPAFEGVHMSCGMLAGPGAVSHVQVEKEGEITVGVVGKCPPIGICGSGIISGINALLKAGVIDIRGVFRSGSSLCPKLKERIIKTESEGKAFVVAYSPEKSPIYISQKDIRELQLAKAAVYAGIELLLKEMHLSHEDIENIYLAGAFGNFLDIESAINLRILPPIEGNKVIPVGNAAAEGAILSLIDMGNLDKVERLAQSIKHVPLSGREDFFKTYMRAMRFGL